MGASKYLKTRARDFFESMHAGWTDEDLLLRPQEFRHFVEVFRVFSGQNLDSYEVSGLLMADRKDGGHGFGRKQRGKRYSTILKLELRASGLEIILVKFQEV